MQPFKERDVRRFCDLLQHKDRGVTQLNALDGRNLIGVGLFDNEDDFVLECHRYNELGQLYAGVNPRAARLLDEYGGLKNRMRTLFVDVVTVSDVASVTAVVVEKAGDLTPAARKYMRDVSRLDDGSLFFPMDAPVAIEAGQYEAVGNAVLRWFFGSSQNVSADLLQMVPVPGTAKPNGTWWRPRFRFQKYRPYILEGIAGAISGEIHVG